MSVTLHTNMGDLKLEVYADVVRTTAENFLALCASGYYNGTKFHRNIKGFMVQGGDPTGTGKGGTSIWGRKFGDEFSPVLKHDSRGILSMANSGPNTNGSQFFITYKPAAHLNNKVSLSTSDLPHPRAPTNACECLRMREQRAETVLMRFLHFSSARACLIFAQMPANHRPPFAVFGLCEGNPWHRGAGHDREGAGRCEGPSAERRDPYQRHHSLEPTRGLERSPRAEEVR
eukprot:SAG11_NODE_64_length_18817_cov_64.238327_20_plen_231_part_00